MYKALKNNVYGHNEGEIFDAPYHAIQVHLEKGEICEVKEIPKIEKVILEETSAIKEIPVIVETPKAEAPKRRGRPARK